MIYLDEALEIVLREAPALPLEEVKLTQSLHRVLAEDVYAAVNIPSLDNSAMDGYALKAKDLKGASGSSPKKFDVLGTVRAGCLPSEKVHTGQAVRIMTGAPVPDGADCVVMVEDTEPDGDKKVRVKRQVACGVNIRKAGEDVRQGERVIEKGELITCAHVGLLASMGFSRVKVVRKPRVAILATGDEILDVGEPSQKGKLYSSNSYSLYAQVLRCGGTPKNLGIAADSRRALKEKIEEALDCDVLVTSGGVSMGDYDLVQSVLEEMGADIRFWKVAIRPGKPVVFAVWRDKPVFGLPGNPVSSMVTFEVLVRPLLFHMLGRRAQRIEEIEAILEEDLKKKKGLRFFLRARTVWKDGGYITRTTGPQGSGILKSMALANSLIVLPEEAELVKRGTKVKVRFVD